MSALPHLAAGAGALTLALVLAVPANATVISSAPDATLTATPFMVSVGGSAANFAFTAARTGNGPSAAVMTTGTGKVSSFFGSVTDFEAGAAIDQTHELYGFSTFPSAAIIPNSAAVDFIGLAFTLSDGLHYGYAEVAGPELVSYGYNSVASASILTGAVAAVPEPTSVALLLVGAAGVIARRRRTRV